MQIEVSKEIRDIRYIPLSIRNLILFYLFFGFFTTHSVMFAGQEHSALKKKKNIPNVAPYLVSTMTATLSTFSLSYSSSFYFHIFYLIMMMIIIIIIIIIIILSIIQFNSTFVTCYLL